MIAGFQSLAFLVTWGLKRSEDMAIKYINELILTTAIEAIELAKIYITPGYRSWSVKKRQKAEQQVDEALQKLKDQLNNQHIGGQR